VPETIRLPAAITAGGPPLWDLIRSRRSRRRYAPKPIPLDAIAQLAWAAQGETGRTRGEARRAAPSAGALYPLETTIAIGMAEGIAPGLYRYDPARHALAPRGGGDPRRAIAEAALGQEMFLEAGAIFLWTAVLRRSSGKYGDRAVRYVCLEAGHAAQNVALAAEALGLAACPAGAFSDGEIARLVGADGTREIAVYLTAVGAPARGR
jgi:SagB-type dehydrogenase family enzyme